MRSGKRIDIAGYSQLLPSAAARQLNERSRKTLGLVTLAEMLSECVALTGWFRRPERASRFRVGVDEAELVAFRVQAVRSVEIGCVPCSYSRRAKVGG